MTPDYVTHYFPAEDGPFRNLSDLPDEEAQAVIKALSARRKADPRFKRTFGPVYLDFRRQVEDKLLALFIASGGQPERQAPHYFVLGESNWFTGAYPNAGRVRLDLSALPPGQTSFTYPDSFAAMRLGQNFGLPPEPLEPYHERVFRLDELDEVVARYGLPGHDETEDYEGYHKRSFEKYIEVQLWSDAPVAKFLDR